MIDAYRVLLSRLKQRADAFRADDRGQIIIIFALASAAIFAGLGAGIDLATAFSARQKLSEVATLACQYSTRPSIGQTAASNYAGTNGFQNYVNAVNAFATASLASQHWNNATPVGAGGATGSYFTATPAAGGSPGSAAAAAPTNPVVEMSAAIPTAFGKILHINSVTVHTKIACQTLAYTPQIVNPPTILQEGFETSCSVWCAANPSGGTTFLSTPTSSFPATAGYVGYNGFKWYIVGYCLETDIVGVINASTPEGSHAAELDCDNGSGSAGNSSISTKQYLEPGQYELRYNYRSRIDYPDYDPTYVCGSTAADVSWANDASGFSPGKNAYVPRTNQINVYLDANLTGTNGSVGSAPLHQTIDGTQYLAGSNLIDMCVYSPTWIERSIRVKVTTPGYYWLSFAADGANDSYGGQLDNIRFCQETCHGSLQDNFPSTWLAANNGGINKILFEDTFASPSRSAPSAPYTYTAGNLNLSTGTSGTATSGWPSLPSSGWATAPYNQATTVVNGAYSGTTQYIELDGVNASGTASASSTNTNRLISRSFLLDPGYYSVSYNYISMANFGSVGTYCYSAPASGFIFGTQANATAAVRYGGTVTANGATNIIGAFMSNGLLVSTPIGGGTQGSLTSYNNPDGSVSSTPTVPPDGVNWANYNQAAVNPVLDVCGFAQNYTWVPQSTFVKITKPGLYWLTFSAQSGTADGVGGAVDDIRLTALGSPYMSSAPSSSLTAIPTPLPYNDTSYAPGTYPGFTIVADPFTPPGADQ